MLTWGLISETENPTPGLISDIFNLTWNNLQIIAFLQQERR